MKALALKKILPALLITTVLVTGFFGVIGTSTVHAEDTETAAHLSPYFIGPRTQEQQKEFEKFEEQAIEESKTGCTGILPGGQKFNLENCATSIFAIMGSAMLTVMSFSVDIAGWTLDKAVNYTVIDMGDNVRSIGAIETGWKVFRDLSNIVIIFVLLFIGIVTILHSQDYNTKALLTKLIAVALLINFSLFFTQVVIDSSNLISLQFYNRITTTKNVTGGEDIIRGVGERYMDAFGLTTIYDGEKIIQPAIVYGKNTFFQIFLISVLGSVVFIVASFAFLAGAFLLIVRFVVLVFLMILAPLAFVGMILPSLSKHANRWWSALMRYAFFAPAYMILTWFVIEVINSEAFKYSIGLDSGASFAAVVNGGSKAILFNFVIVIAFIIASVLISNYFGIIGSDAVMKWGHAARKFGQGLVGKGAMYAPRRVGRFAQLKAGTGAERLQESRSSSARFLRRIPGVVEASGALGAAGRATVKKREELQKDISTASLRNKLGMRTTSIADKEAIAKTLFEREQGDVVEQARIFNDNLADDQRKEAYKNLSAKNRAAIIPYITAVNANTLKGWLSKEEQDKTDDAVIEFNIKEIGKKINTAQTGTPQERANAIQELNDDFNLATGNLPFNMKAKLYRKMSERNRIDIDGILNNQVLKGQLRGALSAEDKDKTEKMEYEVVDKAKIKQFENDLQLAINAGSAAQASAVLNQMTAIHAKGILPAIMANPIVAQGISGDFLSEIHKVGKFNQQQQRDVRDANPNNPFFITEAGSLWAGHN